MEQGTREYTPQQVVDQLGLGKSRQTQQQQQMQHPGRRFIPQLGDCEFTITGKSQRAASVGKMCT